MIIYRYYELSAMCVLICALNITKGILHIPKLNQFSNRDTKSIILFHRTEIGFYFVAKNSTFVNTLIKMLYI